MVGVPLAVKMKTMKYFSFTVFSFISLASCNGLGPQVPGLLDETGIRSGVGGNVSVSTACLVSEE